MNFSFCLFLGYIYIYLLYNYNIYIYILYACICHGCPGTPKSRCFCKRKLAIQTKATAFVQPWLVGDDSDGPNVGLRLAEAFEGLWRHIGLGEDDLTHPPWGYYGICYMIQPTKYIKIYRNMHDVAKPCKTQLWTFNWLTVWLYSTYFW